MTHAEFRMKIQEAETRGRDEGYAKAIERAKATAFEEGYRAAIEATKEMVGDMVDDYRARDQERMRQAEDHRSRCAVELAEKYDQGFDDGVIALYDCLGRKGRQQAQERSAGRVRAILEADGD
jgi:hypothetical protein